MPPKVGKSVIASMVSKMKSAGKTTAEIKKKLSQFAQKTKDGVVAKAKTAKTAAKVGAAVGAGAYVADRERRLREKEEENIG